MLDRQSMPIGKKQQQYSRYLVIANANNDSLNGDGERER